MQIGMSKGWKPVDENDLTVIDNVKIYSRLLTAEEIRADYEKIFPRKKNTVKKFKMSIPPGKKITVDGTLSPTEWDDATIVPLINPVGLASKNTIPAYLYIKADKDHIMTALFGCLDTRLSDLNGGNLRAERKNGDANTLAYDLQLIYSGGTVYVAGYKHRSVTF